MGYIQVLYVFWYLMLLYLPWRFKLELYSGVICFLVFNGVVTLEVATGVICFLVFNGVEV